VIKTNWSLGLNYFVPNKGLNVWHWDDGDAHSEVAEDVKMLGGLPFVFLGYYRSTDQGREFIKLNGIYLNEFGGNTKNHLLKKFDEEQVELYFQKVWVSCRRISYPNSRNDMFVQRASFEQLVIKINKLQA
tara:strand:- start:2586 stop:2978 length:393 start_codon:yes stop_codon:yes gene_type:complete